jgi:hypothetical protein
LNKVESWSVCRHSAKILILFNFSKILLIKPHVIKYASRMQAQKDYFYSAFFIFIYLWFTRLYLFCPLFLLLKFTCVEFQVRITKNDNKTAYNSIQFKALFTVDINHTYNTSSNELLKSTNQSNIITFYNWICLGFYVENILAEWRQTDKLSTLFKIRHPGTY